MELKNKWVLYFDVLGTHDMMKDGNRYLNVMASVFADVAGHINDINSFDFDAGVMDYKIFSDNIIICIDDDSYAPLDFICIVANLIQSTLLLDYGLLIRGAITYGEIYVDENFVFGNALGRAYYLEDKIAIYPRIILDYTQMEPVVLKNKLTLSNYFMLDFDGNPFINYLGHFCKNGELSAERMIYHRNYVTEAIRLSKNDRILQKYQWCKGYHNRFCAENGLNVKIGGE